MGLEKRILISEAEKGRERRKIGKERKRRGEERERESSLHLFDFNLATLQAFK